MNRTEQVVAFFHAWENGDVDRVAAWFTDDAVYHNIPMEQVEGRVAIRALVAAWMDGLRGITFEFAHLVADGDLVLMERVDVVPRPRGEMRLPIMGVIEFDGALISAWREYFDVGQMNDLLKATDL